MSIASSTKKHDAGRIPGPADVPNVVEIMVAIAIPNTKMTHFTVHGYNSGSATVNQSMANALFSSIGSAWSTNLGSYMDPNTKFTSVSVRDMTSHLNPVFVGTGSATAGTGTPPALPPQNAIVLTENVSARGRGAKGRIYLGGWDQSADVTIGGISTTVQTAVTAFGTALFNAITAQSLSPAVAQVARNAYIGYTGTSHSARAASHLLVSSYTCRDLVWDSQRRRAQP